MIPRERFLATIHHQKPDRVPQLIRWGKEVGRKLEQIYGVSGPELEVRIGNDAIIHQMGINAEMEMSIGDLEQGETYTNEWGVKYERRLSFNNPVEHPIKNKKDFEEYQFPDPNDPKKLIRLKLLIEKYKNEFAIIADLSSTLFEVAAAHLRGMEQFLVDCIEDPIFAGRVLDRLVDYYSALGVQAIMEGVDIIRVGDDIGSQRGMLIHPKLWRALVRPRLFRMIQTFRELNPEIIILYHSCGDFRPIIPDLIDIGVQVISSMQEVGSMNLSDIKKEFGEHLAFKGGLDTQYLLPMGTAEDIRAEVRRLILTLGIGGGYIFMPAHLLYGDVPLHNIWAMLEALKDYGKYPLREEFVKAKADNLDKIAFFREKKIESLAQMVENGEEWEVKKWTQKIVLQGVDARDILIHGLQKGVQRIVEEFKRGDTFLPEILMGDKAFNAGMEVLKPYLNGKMEPPRGVIVLGMVKNDLHDIGKNIVKIMFKTFGFRVIDIGVDASPEDFISVVEEEKADILALSARMSTTMTGIRDVIELLKRRKLREKVKVLIGGAPITQHFAIEVGADGYAPDGASGAEKALELMGRKDGLQKNY